jgi:hypothetical protein
VPVPKKLTVNGASAIGPIQPTAAPFPSNESVLSLNHEQQPTADLTRTMSINSPAAFVDMLANTGITALRFISLRVRAGTLDVRASSSAGADQIWRCSDLLVLGNPLTGSEFTAFAVRGVADIEIQLAGT